MRNKPDYPFNLIISVLEDDPAEMSCFMFNKWVEFVKGSDEFRQSEETEVEDLIRRIEAIIDVAPMKSIKSKEYFNEYFKEKLTLAKLGKKYHLSQASIREHILFTLRNSRAELIPICAEISKYVNNTIISTEDTAMFAHLAVLKNLKLDTSAMYSKYIGNALKYDDVITMMCISNDIVSSCGSSIFSIPDDENRNLYDIFDEEYIKYKDRYDKIICMGLSTYVKFLESFVTNRHIDYSKINIEMMDLSARSYNCLKRAGINTLSDLQNYTIQQLDNVRNLSMKCVDEVIKKLNDYGITLRKGYGDE